MLYRLFNHLIFSCRQSLLAIAVLAVLVTTVSQAAMIDIDRIVAVVNDDIITATELQQEIQAVRQQQRLQQMPLPGNDILREKVLERLVMKHIQRQAARNSGITVDDQALNATLRNIAQQNNMSLSEFHDVLERDGLNFDFFRNNIRDEITFRRLRQRQVDSRIQISEQEIDDFLAEQRGRGASADEYHIAHLLIAVDEGASAKQIQQAQAQARDIIKRLQGGENFNQLAIKFSQGQHALEGGDLGWRKSAEVPSIFAAPLVSMKTGEISPVIRSPSGFHIIKLLGHRSGERHIITQTKARHILITPDALTNDLQAQQQLVKLKQQIKQGSDFSELAKQVSADKATATLGGRLGWISPGEMVSEFEQAMNNLQPGQISEPIKTQFGWHLIQVQDRREHDDTESFNRNQIRQHLFSRKAEEEHIIWLRRLRSETYVEDRSEKN